MPRWRLGGRLGCAFGVLMAAAMLFVYCTTWERPVDESTLDYMREPAVKNDAKGIAPLVLAYIETMRHDQLAGVSDPTSPAASCSLRDPFGGYEPHGTPVARSTKAV